MRSADDSADDMKHPPNSDEPQIKPNTQWESHDSSFMLAALDVKNSHSKRKAEFSSLGRLASYTYFIHARGVSVLA